MLQFGFRCLEVVTFSTYSCFPIFSFAHIVHVFDMLWATNFDPFHCYPFKGATNSARKFVQGMPLVEQGSDARTGEDVPPAEAAAMETILLTLDRSFRFVESSVAFLRHHIRDLGMRFWLLD